MFACKSLSLFSLGSLSFLDVYICIFHKIWGLFKHYSSILSSLFSLSLSSVTFIMCTLICFIMSHRSLRLFFIQFHRLNNLNWPISSSLILSSISSKLWQSPQIWCRSPLVILFKFQLLYFSIRKFLFSFSWRYIFY